MPRDARGRFVSTGPATGVWTYIDVGIPAVIRNEGTRRLNTCAELVVGFIREKMSEPKSGRTYRIPGTAETYQASSPGEYPAVRTGNLWLSLKAQKMTATKFAVGSEVEYAPYLEAGLRPFLQRAARETMPLLQQEMCRPWKLNSPENK